MILVVAALAVVGIFVGGLAFLNRGSSDPTASPTASVATITCIGGSEKSGLMADPEVKKILAEKYAIAVTYQPMGSYDQVTLPDDELKKRGADCLWPSSVSAQYVFEATHSTSDYPGYRAETVLQSPEVIYAGPAGTAALVKAGLVEERDGRYVVTGLKKLMTDYVAKAQPWSAIKAVGVGGPMQIASTDPAKSNSGFTLYQLMLTMLATDDVYQAPDVAQARQALPALRRIYDSQGLQARSSDAGFDQWLLKGGESYAPLYAGYESQIVQKLVAYQGNAEATKLLTQDVRILYPEPTIYSDHPVLALTPDADRFVDAMKDPEVQAIAWKTYGFRSGTEIGLAKVEDFPSLPLLQTLRTTPPPNAAVTQLLLACIRQNVCS